MKSIITLIAACLFCTHATAQRNEILNSRISSVQVVAGTEWLSMPVIKLHDSKRINISFDDLTHEYHRYVYKVEHCEADWSTSESLFTSDYVQGFADGISLDNLTESINTNVLYTHYRLTIPNENCRLKLSGNYRVTIYDENNDNEEVLRVCFMVVEPLMGVMLQVNTNTDAGINSTYQQVGLSVNYAGVRVPDYSQQIKTVVLQNGRWDNARVLSKPQFIMGDGLRWEHERDLIFFGGNEYRKFEILDVHDPGLGIEAIEWDGAAYHAYLWPAEPRLNYLYDEDANGAFYIRNNDNYENDRTSEYVLVHFTLKLPRQAGDVYLNGTWTNDQFTPRYKMEYDELEECYHTVLSLKLGYYSYQYLMMTDTGDVVPLASEGSFFQTENSYQALVYYRGVGERTDRLVGFQQVKFK
ncbi:MAG: DUF5103 domain-containing protein [Prevotella sp.]|nr:DUF5103 domain-containing protein [Prevotella sp.]